MRLVAHAGRLQKFQLWFEESVPVSLARACRVANFRSGAVIIHAGNGAVAAKLRQLAPTLGDVFRSKGEQVTEIIIKVQPRDVAAQHDAGMPPRPPILSEAGRSSLERLSATLNDGPLREAVRRLLSLGAED